MKGVQSAVGKEENKSQNSLEEVKKEKNITPQRNNHFFGGLMAKPMETGLRIFYTFIAVYGFLAFLNSREFPITRILLEKTKYFYLAQYDHIFGVILLVIGLYLLLER